MSKIFLSTSTILMTLIASPGWATNSKSLIRSELKLPQVLSYSNSPHSISINQVMLQELPSNAKTELENRQRLLSEKAVTNSHLKQKSTPRPSPQRGAPKPIPDRD